MLAEREDSVCGAGRAALGSGDSWSTSQENRSRALLWPAPAGRNPGCPGDAGSPPLWCFRETRPLCFHIHKMGLPPPFSWPHTSLSVPQGILSPVLMVPGCWGLRAGNAATILRTHSWGAGANAGQEGRGGGGGDMGGGTCQLASRAAGRRLAGRVQGLLYLTSLSLAFFPLVGNSPPLGAQKLRTPLLEARCPQGRRSGKVLSLP